MQQHAEQKPEQFGTPNAEPNEQGGAQWRTVGEVAALLGVSERAVQKRCTAGTLSARRMETPKGAVWEIDARSIQQRPNKAVRDAEPNRELSPSRTVRRSEPTDAAPDRSMSSAPDFAGRYVEQLEQENRFLRSQVEEGNRNAAELRAALREALKAQPRQLEQGNAAPEAPSERVHSPGTNKDTPGASNPAKSPAIVPDRATAKEPRPIWKVILGIR